MNRRGTPLPCLHTRPYTTVGFVNLVSHYYYVVQSYLRDRVEGMMRIPMKVDYGVRALIDLAQHGDSGPVTTSDIAYRQSIPEAYLDQLLTTQIRAHSKP